MPLPLLLAADLPIGAEVPFVDMAPADVGGGMLMPSYNPTPELVDRFDPAARAVVLAAELPRVWCGTYRGFRDGAVTPATLRLASLTPMGQIVDLRGRLNLGATSTPVQGNLNAKSDQLDMVPMTPEVPAMLEFGGGFSGLQGLQLSGWNAPRLTNPGGRLELSPEACLAEAPVLEPAAPIRGLW
ncbi:hypothetical protein EVJ50_10230 [Synechococcus sp. RSCCF101]|nr:hypothetical protein EVJ50_10230 [Synechococcus sp. RSCCF101]